MMYFYDIVSASLIGFYMFPFLKFIETNEFIYVIMGLGMCITDYVTKLIKAYTGHIFPRPVLARDCDILCRNGSCGGKPGFPSGHAASMAFFTTFYIS